MDRLTALVALKEAVEAGDFGALIEEERNAG
jgi:hypothetical protein